jgi:rhodanese-related sulfurtransferase
MKTREKLTILLLCLGVILALLPLSGNRSFTGKPALLLSEILKEDLFYSADQVAKFIVSEDSTIQLIDLRPAEKYNKETLPGAVNVVFSELIGSDPDKYLNNSNLSTIFVSDDGYESALAMTFTRGLGYRNSYILQGGMDSWNETIMESKFSGERISARENALFETRSRAARLYSELNTLPDSLKLKFLESKRFSAKKLDGGCE